ncbi:unnamed protein product [Protopolystoma xenopodis]|uniref:Cadherin domain-containing protein n=1 Tax=Protopolystoma xenopodis TaxID=117903 RepID=A0A3S5CNV0_9PLAT|nr:unnamed protein product [Protopolystoma xenopodis]
MGSLGLLCLLLLVRLHPGAGIHKPRVVEFKVKEESPPMTRLATVTGLLPSLGSSSSFIMSQEDSYFRVEPNGNILLTRRLDLESLCVNESLCCEASLECIVEVTAIQEDIGTDGEVILLRGTVVDINDHVPVFSADSYSVFPDGTKGQLVQIPENAQVRHLLDLIPAQDDDVSRVNQITTYKLIGDEIRSMFDLDVTKLPDVRLRLSSPLDYEAVKSYSGLLEACDKSNCSSQPLLVKVLDENDNKPKFQQPAVYNVSIPEDLARGSLVIALNATDDDSPEHSKMYFSFYGSADSKLKQHFRLDHSTGRIILMHDLAANVRQNYTFQVSVSESPGDVDPGAVAQVSIHVIDVNNHRPDIRLLNTPASADGVGIIRIRENEPARRLTFVKVIDSDLGRNRLVTCDLYEPENGLEKYRPGFALKPSSEGIYLLYSTREFDAETQPALRVVITCRDAGDPPLSSEMPVNIFVEDENEFDPEFEQATYVAGVRENAPSRIPVLQVSHFSPLN